MLVNTIEFNGEKAVINSYSSAYVREYGMTNIEIQRMGFAARFPNATVLTEELHETEVVRLVSEGRAKGDHLYSHSHAVGKLSEGA